MQSAMTAIEMPNAIEDFDEQEWLYAAAHNPAFDFLYDPTEDIYSLYAGTQFQPTSSLDNR